MPVVTITLLQGYDEETRQTLGERLTDAVRATIAAPLEGITVILHEVAKPVGYMRGRVSRTPGAPLPSPAKLVRAYLDAAAARDFGKAGEMVADGFTSIYPGGVEFGSLEELMPWAEERYRSVKKTYERIDEVACEEGVAVYAFGTLGGQWPDGTAFEGVRFIDRFTVRDGKLADQRVWNDLAESRTAPA
ncbi:MAG: tautomerase family protein [Rhodospirillales bacterium]|jgi:4-oxalocrotonate tautomerase family enzyme|nr:tautomerase family protein [Rhodospirillales bacterium]MDP6774679.1 tautomerase family protein [Rhodospirillales bacterium]